MTFDPFGDFATEGYLRNIAKEKDLTVLRRLEHFSFVTGLEPAFRELSTAKTLTYEHILSTHKILFEAIYPWAGQDRLALLPEHAITKGGVRFADPGDIRRAVDHGLRIGQDKRVMTAKPGEVMGYLAFAHPFLDGNGRTIMVIHSLLAQRAGFSIDWGKTSKVDYLNALTKEIEEPGKDHLDAYLATFKGPAIAYDKLAAEVERTPGLVGAADLESNKVIGKIDEPTVRAAYEQIQVKRSKTRT